MTKQRPEGALKPLLSHKPFEVSVLTTCKTQKLAVRTCGSVVDRAADQIQEIVLASLKAPLENHLRTRHIDPIA
jgi:hypothetical protein